MCLYVSSQKHNLSPKYWKLEYRNNPKLSQVAQTMSDVTKYSSRCQKYGG